MRTVTSDMNIMKKWIKIMSWKTNEEKGKEKLYWGGGEWGKCECLLEIVNVKKPIFLYINQT